MKRSPAIEKILEKMQSKAVASTSTAGLNMVAKMRTVLRGIESLEKVASNRFPSETVDGHYLRVSRDAKRLREEFTRLGGDVMIILQSESEAVNALISNRFKPSANAGEIRDVLRKMSMEDRHAFVTKAIEKKDSEVIAAIRGAHPMLSGLDSDFHGRIVDSAEKLLEPEAVARREEILDMYNGALTALATAEKTLDELDDPKKLSDIEKKENQAKEAENSLNEALQERSFNVQQDI